MGFLYIAELTIVAFICLLGVLHPRYEDNLLQRVGMACTCIGCMAQILILWRDHEGANALTVTMAGVSAFAIGTVWKKWRQRGAEKTTQQLEG